MATAEPPPVDPAPSPPEKSPSIRRNALARSSDRTESAVVLVSVMLWLLALPICVVVGFLWWQHLSMDVADQQRSRMQVVATTTADAPEFVVTQRGVPLDDFVPVAAQWVGGTGATHTGTVLAPTGAAAGSTQRIWVNREGDLTEAPLDSAGAVITVVLSVSGLWLCWGGLLYGGRSALRFRLDRQRMADWDAQWRQVEPHWSGRHPAP